MYCNSEMVDGWWGWFEFYFGKRGCERGNVSSDIGKKLLFYTRVFNEAFLRVLMVSAVAV